MSVQDQIAFPVNDKSSAKAGDGILYRLLLASVVCFAVVLVWTLQFANTAQIVAMALALSIGLNARAVMKLEEIDAQGLEAKPAWFEAAVGTVIIAMLGAASLIAASSIFTPLAGLLPFVFFIGMSAAFFAAAIAFEAAVSVLACFALKPLFSKSAIGAEIAVMLNLQQKFQTRLA